MLCKTPNLHNKPVHLSAFFNFPSLSLPLSQAFGTSCNELTSIWVNVCKNRVKSICLNNKYLGFVIFKRMKVDKRYVNYHILSWLHCNRGCFILIDVYRYQEMWCWVYLHGCRRSGWGWEQETLLGCRALGMGWGWPAERLDGAAALPLSTCRGRPTQCYSLRVCTQLWVFQHKHKADPFELKP